MIESVTETINTCTIHKLHANNQKHVDQPFLSYPTVLLYTGSALVATCGTLMLARLSADCESATAVAAAPSSQHHLHASHIP